MTNAGDSGDTMVPLADLAMSYDRILSLSAIAYMTILSGCFMGMKQMVC
jgi:hypothetical protein